MGNYRHQKNVLLKITNAYLHKKVQPTLKRSTAVVVEVSPRRWNIIFLRDLNWGRGKHIKLKSADYISTRRSSSDLIRIQEASVRDSTPVFLLCANRKTHYRPPHCTHADRCPPSYHTAPAQSITTERILRAARLLTLEAEVDRTGGSPSIRVNTPQPGGGACTAALQFHRCH